MRSATFRARLGRIVLAVSMAFSTAAVLTAVPDPARATVSSNYCFEYYETWIPSEDLNMCSTASGQYDIWNRNLLFPVLATYLQYMYTMFTGGPYAAFMRQAEQQNGQNRAQHLANSWIDPNLGRGMPAGATPTRTFGEAIDGWLQPLRDYNVNTWFNTSWSNPEDDFSLTRYESDVWTLTLGADMPIINESTVFGVFGSYTNSDVDTTFNNGHVDTEVGTFGPYVAYTFNEYLGFDMTVAGVFGQNENVIGPPPGSPAGSASINGDQDTRGFFISWNANANYWIGNWGVQGRFGILYSDMETDSYAIGPSPGVHVPGSDNELTQIQAALQLNYFYDRGLPMLENVMAMPYVRFTVNYDAEREDIQLPPTSRQAANDDEEVVVNWGVTLFGNGPLSGSLEAGYTGGREDFESFQMSGTVSYAF